MAVAKKRSTTVKRKAPATQVKRRATTKAKVAKKKAPSTKLTYLNTAKTAPIREKLTKTQQYQEIAELTGLSKRQVQAVFEAEEALIVRSIKRGAVGQITLPLGLKIEVKQKPARKARKGINPFTGEEMQFKAKPASRVVKIRPLKRLKDFAQ